MVSLLKRTRSQLSSVDIIIKRHSHTHTHTQVSRKKLVNHYEWSKKRRAIQTVKLKYGTANATKQQYLKTNRTEIESQSFHQYKKYLFLLKDKKNQIHHKKSIDILRKCEKDGIKPNIVLYSKVLDNCSKNFAPNMVLLKIIEEMITKYNINPNFIILSSLLNGFQKNGSYFDCILLYGLTRNCVQIDIKPLFKDYKKSREISYVLSNETLLNAFKDIESNLVSANIILKCIGKIGNTKKVTEFLQSLIKSGTLPNDVTLNCIINTFADNQNIKEMEKMFQWWLQNESSLEFSPDIVTINSMLGGYTKSRQFDKSQELFNKYCSKEHNSDSNDLLMPTQITFGHIIRCAANCVDDSDEECKLKMRDNALKYYKKMQVIYGMDDYYNICTAATMNVCLRCNDLKTMLKIFDENRRQNKLDRAMYNIALRALFQNGLIGEALNLFQEGAELNILRYLSPGEGAYSMDLHHFNVASAVIAVMHNLKTLCDTIMAREKFKVPTVWIIVGKGKHSMESEYNNILLKDALPDMLRDERLFYPKLESSVPHWNTGMVKIDDDSLLEYIAFQLKVDVEELRPRFAAFNSD